MMAANNRQQEDAQKNLRFLLDSLGRVLPQ